MELRGGANEEEWSEVARVCFGERIRPYLCGVGWDTMSRIQHARAVNRLDRVEGSIADALMASLTLLVHGTYSNVSTDMIRE